MERPRGKAANPQTRIGDVAERAVPFRDVGSVLEVVNVDIRTDVGVDFNRVKAVVAEVVVSKSQVNLAGDDGAPLFGVETDVEVGVFENIHGLVGVHFVKVDVAHANADAALVFSAGRFVIRGWVVVEGLAAVGLVAASGGVGIGQADGVGGRDAGQGEVAGVDVAQEERRDEILRERERTGDVKRNPLNPNTQRHVRRWLRKPRVHHDGIGLRIGKGDVKGQTLHQRNFEMLEFVPERVVDVQGAHGPLECRANPQLGGHTGDTGKRVVRGFNAKPFAKCGQSFKGQRHRQIIGTVPVDVNVILKQHQVGADEEFAGEGALVPRFVRWAVVAR